MPWLVANHVGEMYLLPPRGDCGSRHDFSTEAAMYLYHDRPFYLEFLQSRMYGDDNILEDAIFVMLSCVEIVGEIRARAIIHDKVRGGRGSILSAREGLMRGRSLRARARRRARPPSQSARARAAREHVARLLFYSGLKRPFERARDSEIGGVFISQKFEKVEKIFHSAGETRP